MKTRRQRIKNKILGEKFDLSVAFLNSRAMKKLNKRYRRKDYAPDALSFGLSKKEGEVLLNKRIEKDKNYADYLLLHSLLHLKGLRHGKKMEDTEKKLIKYFKIRL